MQQINLKLMTNEDLSAIMLAAHEELCAREEGGGEPVKAFKGFGSYNSGQMGKPWIAVVTSWPVKKRPEIVFGTYEGDDGGGVAEVMARPGDIVRFGQKNHRSWAKSIKEWGVVGKDGSVSTITEEQARSLWDERQK